MKIVPDSLKDIIAFEKQLHSKDEKYWIKRGEKRALELFHFMAERVPAYKDLLKSLKIKSQDIQTIDDYKKHVPIVDKESYLRKYPLHMLCVDSDLTKAAGTYSATSGTSGSPFYFPRKAEHDEVYAKIAELYLRTNFKIHKRKTLYINCFAMGAWIGGVFTHQAISKIIETQKYQLSIISPGIQKDIILKTILALADNYDQILLGGYPPFIKDLIDEGESKGVIWDHYSLGFIFSAEGFSESFRDYILMGVGSKDTFYATLNHYGTVDLGTMAHETPYSIWMRRSLTESDKLSGLVGSIKMPTIGQYLPELYYFEEIEKQLVCSSYAGIPLTRYHLKDVGGVILKSDADSYLEKQLTKKQLTAKPKDEWNLPIVYVFERNHFCVKLYGANIYAESIRQSLIDSRIEKQTTGKCNLEIKTDDKKNQYLLINVELRPGIFGDTNLKQTVTNIIVSHLLKVNTEYRSNYSGMKERQIPVVRFWKYEDEELFKPGAKQKWVR